MKKLHLLKPDLRTGYLGRKKRECVNYLKIPANLTLEKLNEDIGAGANQYLECLRYFDKDQYQSKVIYIDCDTREEGLMAVSYMVAALNRMEAMENGWDTGWDDVIVEDEDDINHLFETEDTDEWTDTANFDDTDIEETEIEWIETHDRVPIIDIQDIRTFYNNNWDLTPFNDGPMIMEGSKETKKPDPYWTVCNEYDICIEAGAGAGAGFGFGFGFSSGFSAEDIKLIKRFRRNRHVFLLAPKEQRIYDDDEIFGDEDLDDCDEAFKCDLLLEFTAEILQLRMKKDERTEYYINLFENWLQKYDLKTQKGFPKRMVVDQILKVKGKDKSNLMDSILQYATKKKKLHGILKKEDLLELAIFKTLLKEKNIEKNALHKFQNELVGMEEVKQQVLNIINVIKFNRLREQMGLPAQNYHNVFMFIGAPGTAKTTVAKMMGGIMKEMRLLPDDRFVCVNGAELKAKYVGHSAPKTKKLFENNDIIFIDEAYSLVSGLDGEMDSFGQEAMAQLMIELEKHSTDKLVMFAGYGGSDVTGKNDKMKAFLNANPGLRSRINSTIVFSSYKPEEMVEIVHCQAKAMEFNLAKKADQSILEYFKKRVGDVNFGNGREARSLLENSLLFVAKRVMNLPEEKRTKKQMQTIMPEDIECAIVQMQSNMDAQVKKNSRTNSSYGFYGN